MSAITYKPEAAKRGHEQVIDEEYEQGGDPDYDDAGQTSYDESSQADYGMDFADADADDGGSQEWRLRPQR